ncbi:MAG: NAD(P)/FAD-dependent oxidoreductase, partial [Ilumatobacteraceae bacterium]
VGAGPNGLLAAVRIAMTGRSVTVYESNPRVGGGARSAELTLPGFVHDVCSAIHPLGVSSPAFNALPLERHGLRWIHPDVVLAHPLVGHDAGVVWRDIDRTLDVLGRDGAAWSRHISSFAHDWERLAPMLLGPLVQVPAHPVSLARFGVRAVMPAQLFWKAVFHTPQARALFAGSAGHASLPLTHPLTSSFGLLLLVAAHAVGWPVAEGGSQAISNALASLLGELGGTIETGRPVTSLEDLPPSRAVLFDVGPRSIVSIAGDRLSPSLRRRLLKYRYGPGAFKIDYALSEAVPWTDDHCRSAGTVHVCGDADDVARAEADVARGKHAERPFVLVAQQSLIDPSRAPAGAHTLWVYTHVPNGSDVDVTAAIESQIERFAPGFKDVVLARHVTTPSEYESYNTSFVGGNIAGGSNGGLQLAFRPVVGRPYRTSDPALFMCSAATPPGGGVHGMCGFYSAGVALDGVLADASTSKPDSRRTPR